MANRQPIPQEWVESIFTRLSAQLGSKIADLWGGINPDAVKAEWADALAGYERDEISRGIDSCQTRVFAPTLGEFLRLCRPALDPEIAWLEAVEGMAQRSRGEKGEWTHPGVYRAASEMAYELRTGSFKQHRRRWEWLLTRELRKGSLLGVPTPMQRIGMDSQTRPPNELERRILADLRSRSPAPPQRRPFDENADTDGAAQCQPRAA